MNKEFESYYKEVKKELQLPKKDSIRLLDSLKESFYELEDKNPNITYQDICENLGTPESLAKTYIETADLYDVRRIFTRKKRFLTAGLAVLIVAVTVTIGIIAFKTYSKYRNGYFVEKAPIQSQSLPEVDVWEG